MENFNSRSEYSKGTENKHGGKKHPPFSYLHQYTEGSTRGKSPRDDEHKWPLLDKAPKPAFDQNITEEFQERKKNRDRLRTLGIMGDIPDPIKQMEKLSIEMKLRDGYNYIIGKMENNLYEKKKHLGQLIYIKDDFEGRKGTKLVKLKRIRKKAMEIVNSKKREEQIKYLADRIKEIRDGGIEKLEKQIEGLSNKVENIKKREEERIKRFNTDYTENNGDTLLQKAESQRVTKRKTEMQSSDKERIDKKYNAFQELDDFKSYNFGHLNSTKDQLLRGKAEPILREVDKELKSKWEKIPFLRDFPLERAWKLCLDGRYQGDKGPNEQWKDYEPLFHAGTRRLLNAVIDGLCIDGQGWEEHSPQKLTKEYYEQLHDIAIAGTYTGMRKGDSVREFEIGFREPGRWVKFTLEHRVNMSQSGFKELQDKIDCRKGGPKKDPRYGEAGHPVGNCHPKALSKSDDGNYYDWEPRSIDLKENVEAILQKCHEELTIAKEQKDEDAKLIAIVRCCQDLELVHAFSDGNGRTISFGVLTKLLIENDLTPCIMYETCHLDGYSVEEIKAEIRQGQKTFQKECLRL